MPGTGLINTVIVTPNSTGRPSGFISPNFGKNGGGHDRCRESISARQSHSPRPVFVPTGLTKRVIGNATLYLADCFDVLPQLSGMGAVVTDPPYGIGFKYRSYDDATDRYDALMARLVPELIRVTANGPCFVWQSPLKADRWHAYSPKGWRIVAACKLYPSRPGKGNLPQLGSHHLLERLRPAPQSPAARLARR